MATVSNLFCTRSRRKLANVVCSILYCGRISKTLLLATSSAVTCLNRQFGLITTTRPFFSMQCTP